MALRPAPQAKKVLIAGGGIAGIEAADALYKRGHHPILCEAGDTLGGQFVLAGAAPRKGDFQLAAYMAAENIRDLGVEIRTNTPVTPHSLRQKNRTPSSLPSAPSRLSPISRVLTAVVSWSLINFWPRKMCPRARPW